MPSQPARMSVVIPVRDGENAITRRVEQLLEALSDMTREASEVVVVDDGSRDSTPEVLDDLEIALPADSSGAAWPAARTRSSGAVGP